MPSATSKHFQLLEQCKCVSCCKPNDNGLTRCDACTQRKQPQNTKRAMERYHERRAQGVCVGCGKAEPIRADKCLKCWERQKTSSRKMLLKRDYGITTKQYSELLVAQNYKCAICGVPHQECYKGLHIDHGSKGVRGLLCSNCNTAIGLFYEDIDNLKVAISYLEGGDGEHA